MNGSSDIKSKIYDILSDKRQSSTLLNRFGFIETKAFKLLLVLLFYFFLYDLLKNIFLFFGFTSSILVHMYLSWIFILFLLWALLPQKLSYL